MEKKDPCAVFGCNNDRLFPGKYTVKDHISNTKLEKVLLPWVPEAFHARFPVSVKS